MSRWKQSNIGLSFFKKSADLIVSAKVELFHDLVHSFHNLKKLSVTCGDFHTEKSPAEDEMPQPQKRSEVWNLTHQKRVYKLLIYNDGDGIVDMKDILLC